MKEQFQHKAMTSLALWFDNTLLKKGEAFSNHSGNFQYYSDDRLDNRYSAFGSPYKQWVTDSSISGVIIPSGAYINGTFVPKGNRVKIDFINGRILVSGASPSDVVNGAYSVKDFNIYASNIDEDDLLIDKRYKENPRIYSPQPSHVDPYDMAIPAAFLSITSIHNDPFAFGGEDTSTVSASVVVISDNLYNLDGILSIFSDTRNEIISTISLSNDPINEYGDLKSGTYSYLNYQTGVASGLPFYVDSVNTSKLSDKARASIINNLYVGFIDFDLKQNRFPRI